jgi:hypothetical protein
MLMNFRTTRMMVLTALLTMCMMMFASGANIARADKKHLSAANDCSSGGDRCDQWSGDYGDGFG